MKYVTSNLAYEYNIEGVILPKRNYTVAEMNEGRSAVLALEDGVYEALLKNAFFKRNLDSGNFTVADAAPFEKLSDSEKARVYQSKSAEAVKEVDALKKAVESKDKAIKALQEKLGAAQAAAAEKDKAIEALNAKLEGKKK